MILDRFRIDGKVALVTGGTRGIGLAIACALGEAGARVIISGRTLQPEAEEALKSVGIDVEFIPANMEDVDAAQLLVEQAIALAGRLDILVNNAGIALNADSEHFSPEQWHRLMTINVDSVFRTCQAALGPMKAQGSGVILNMGSISALISNIPQNQVAYNASKAAVHQMTKSLASEFAADNIRVNAIAPGYINTDMTKRGFENPEWAPVWTSMTPMGRAGEPEEVATAALFLCAPASSYMTGEIMVIDGGYTTR